MSPVSGSGNCMSAITREAEDWGTMLNPNTESLSNIGPIPNLTGYSL